MYSVNDTTDKAVEKAIAKTVEKTNSREWLYMAFLRPTQTLQIQKQMHDKVHFEEGLDNDPSIIKTTRLVVNKWCKTTTITSRDGEQKRENEDTKLEQEFTKIHTHTTSPDNIVTQLSLQATGKGAHIII